MIVIGHADSISPETLQELKDDYPQIKLAQWFLDPFNRKGPDYDKNKKRILDKSEIVDANFITTSPDVLNFTKKDSKLFYTKPADSSFETLNNFKKIVTWMFLH